MAQLLGISEPQVWLVHKDIYLSVRNKWGLMHARWLRWKESACNVGDQVRSLGWEDPLEKEMATHSSILAWRIPWTGAPSGLQFMGLQRVRHNWGINTQSIAKCNPHLSHANIAQFKFLLSLQKTSKFGSFSQWISEL